MSNLKRDFRHLLPDILGGIAIAIVIYVLVLKFT